MSWYARVEPRKDTQDEAGACLRYSQSVFGAPATPPEAPEEVEDGNPS